MAVFEVPSWQSSFMNTPVISAGGKDSVWLYCGHEPKSRLFHLLLFTFHNDSVVITPKKFRYKRKSGIHKRSDISDLLIHNNSIYAICYDKLVMWDTDGNVRYCLAIDQKSAWIQPLDQGKFLLSYYYDYDMSPNDPINQLWILSPNGKVLHSRVFPPGDVDMTYWDHTSTHATQNNHIIRGNMSEAAVWLLNDSLKTLDSLQLDIPYWKSRPQTASSEVSQWFSGRSNPIYFTEYCKLFTLKFIEENLILGSFSCTTTCNGQVLLEIKDGKKLSQVGEIMMDGWGFWQDNKWIPADYRYAIDDLEWLNQPSRSCIKDGLMYAIHPGLKETPVGKTRAEYRKLLNTPVLDDVVYFYITKSQFLGIK